MEKEKLDLEGAKNEAEQYLGMQKEVATRQHTLYQRYMSVNEGNPIPGPSPHLPFLSLKVFILHAVSNENHSLISHTFCYEWPGLEIGS